VRSLKTLTALTAGEFNRIRDYVRNYSGISLSDEKKSLVYSRLRPVLEKNNFNSFTEYIDYLVNDKTANVLAEFINKITTNHTYFMRESDHFEYLRDIALPYIEANYAAKKDLRLWCAAASTGEEPYTLQMIINDYFESKPGWNIETLATDISSNVLTKAVAGLYPEEKIKELPREWTKKYFIDNKNQTYTVCPAIKNNITFRKFNLMNEMPRFKQPLQIIFCRNVMIYFDLETRYALINRLYNVLDRGGYLFLGHSETLNNMPDKFKFAQPSIYTRN